MSENSSNYNQISFLILYIYLYLPIYNKVCSKEMYIIGRN